VRNERQGDIGFNSLEQRKICSFCGEVNQSEDKLFQSMKEPVIYGETKQKVGKMIKPMQGDINPVKLD
jgi:hypothetical protein